MPGDETNKITVKCEHCGQEYEAEEANIGETAECTSCGKEFLIKAEKNKGALTQDRVIRVFISSTFRDMQVERELLVKKVFPELRRLCDERFVTFTEVDLRWGITQEQQAEGKVLPICLEEIYTCRPYFIGLLGERYGWIPNTVPQEVLDKEPWIKEYVGKRTSVTELEILHGVLRNKEMAGHSFFYFRDPAYIATLPEQEQREMVERDIPDDIKQLGPEEATRRTEERKKKLAALKDTIRQSHLPLVDPYANPNELAEQVRKQFTELIDLLYPKEQVPNQLDQEAIGHRSYAQRKLLACIKRPTHLTAINAFVEATSSGKGFVVTGDSGGGKTALLASWTDSYRKTHPDHFVLEHYFGATSDSTSVPRFLSRLLGELKRLAEITEDIPSDPKKMAELLPLWLAQAGSRKKRIVLVLDALNQIQGEPSDCNLAWLPKYFPQQVRVIASALPGVALNTLKQHGWSEHPLPLPDAVEREQMVQAFLGHYRKDLGKELRRQVVTAPGSVNPLFLRTVLEELRQFGDFEHLPDKVQEYLRATTPMELFRQVIRRWQADFHADRDVVHRSLRYLWAARMGLGDAEWLELLADKQGPMDRQTLRPLQLAMESHLAQRSGLWAFGHDFLKQAVEVELLPDQPAKEKAHLELANYFEPQLAGPRKAFELPYQLREAGQKERLTANLLDIPLFLLIRERDENELLGYWVWLKEDRTMGQPYLQAFQHWAGDKGEPATVSYAANQLACFLAFSAALHTDAEPLMRRALDINERSLGKDHPVVATCLSNLAELLRATNRFAEAEPLMRRALKIAEQSYGENHPDVATCLSNLALLLQATNRLADAEPLYHRALKIAEQSYGENHPSVAIKLNNLAGLLKETNRLADAEPLYRRALKIAEQSYGENHPDVARGLNNLAVLLKDTNRLADAEPLMRRALKIDEQSYGENHPDVARDLSNLAVLLKATNRLADAEPLMRRALKIDEQSYGENHPDVAISLNNLAQLLQDTNRLAEAEPLMRRALKIDEQSYGENHPDVARNLNNLAALLKDTNRLADAEPLMRRALKIFETSLGSEHPNVATQLNNLAALLQDTNRFAEAEPLMRRALKIAEQSYGENHPDVARGLNNLALLLQATNRLADAEPLMRRMVKIFLKFTRETGHPHPHLQAALANYASLLQAMGRSQEEIQATLRKMAPEFLGDLTTLSGGSELSPKLRAVIDQLNRDLSKAKEIATKLQREDPKLFMELVQWHKSQQKR